MNTLLSPNSHLDASTQLAEKRKTQVSTYLVSQDFKANFATKLNHHRQREMNVTTSPPPPTFSPNLKRDKAIYPHPHSHPNLSPRGNLDDLSLTSSTSLSGLRMEFIDENSIKEEPETEDYSSTSSMQKDGVSNRSSLRTSADAEEQSARYEVIRKLADQLAEQIEENDHLLYELGVVRSNNARLQSLAVDREDELACLNERIAHLQSRPPSTTPIPSPLPATPPSLPRSDAHPQALTLIQSLKSELKHVRNTLCQIQLELTSPTSQSKDHCNIPKIPHLHPETTTPIQSSERETQPRRIRRRHSFSGASSQLASIPQIPSLAPFGPQAPIRHIGETAEREDFSSIINRVHQLEVELFECHEARITTGVTLQALIDTISDDSAGESMPGVGQAGASADGEEQGGTGAGPGSFSSKIFDMGIWQAPRKESKPAAEGAEEAAAGPSSPIMSLASFGFGGWGRKPSEAPSVESCRPSEASATPTVVVHAALPADEPSSFMKFGLRLFNYSSSQSSSDKGPEPPAPAPSAPPAHNRQSFLLADYCIVDRPPFAPPPSHALPSTPQ